MPPWAYAAIGAGGVMSLLLMIFVVKSLVGGPDAAAALPDACNAGGSQIADGGKVGAD